MPMRRLRSIAALLCVALLTWFPRTTLAKGAVYLPGFPTLRQERRLTCESSAASMATRGAITESQIMAAMPRKPNPNLGFRGNPDGKQGTTLTNYGVYAQPVHAALLRYGYRSDLLSYQPDWSLISYINRGWPVVTWVTYALQPVVPRLARWNGEQFFLVPHEHAVLVVGYSSSEVIANDPWTGRTVAYDWGNFNRSWGYFGNMALAVEPCPLPASIEGLHVSRMDASRLTWSWKPAANADHYEIILKRVDVQSDTVWQGSHTNPRYTLHLPVPGAEYVFDVRSVSTCNGTSSWARLWAQLPAALPTPVEATLSPQPIPTGTPLPGTSGTATPPTGTPGTPSATPASTGTPLP